MLWLIFGVAFATSQPISAGGGIVDDANVAFETFGPSQYWRSEIQGYNGGLRWTNAVTGTSGPINWAWWQVDCAEEGDYLVEWYATPAFAMFSNVEYEIMADSISNMVNINQSAGASGWNAIGTYHFAVGVGQYIAVYDTGPASSGQHIVADAVRLTRVGDWCGDGICTDFDEDCSSCPDDCLLAVEDPSNGLDDDCNGLIDDDAECEGQAERDWCLDASTLGACQGGEYSETYCFDVDQICSINILDCVDAECLGREDDIWCQGDLIQDCENGQLLELDCGDQGETCEQGECVSETVEPSAEPATEPATEPSFEPGVEPSEEVDSLEGSGNEEKSDSGCLGLTPSNTAWLILPIVPLLFRRRKN